MASTSFNLTALSSSALYSDNVSYLMYAICCSSVIYSGLNLFNLSSASYCLAKLSASFISSNYFTYSTPSILSNTYRPFSATGLPTLAMDFPALSTQDLKLLDNFSKPLCGSYCPCSCKAGGKLSILGSLTSDLFLHSSGYCAAALGCGVETPYCCLVWISSSS